MAREGLVSKTSQLLKIKSSQFCHRSVIDYRPLCLKNEVTFNP